MKLFFLKAVSYLAATPLVVGLVRFKQLDRPAKVLLGYLGMEIIVNVVALFMAMHRTNNLLLLRSFTIVEFLAFSLFFIELFRSRKLSAFIITVGVAFVIFAGFTSFYVQNMNMIDSYARATSAIFLLIYCFIFFDRAISAENDAPWAANPVNWFVTGAIIYFASTFLFFIFANVLAEKLALKQSLMAFWNGHAFMDLTAHVFYTIGFLKCRK